MARTCSITTASIVGWDFVRRGKHRSSLTDVYSLVYEIRRVGCVAILPRFYSAALQALY